MTVGPPAVVPETHLHVVNFYDDDEHVIADVTRFLADGFLLGDAAVVVATEAHRDALEAALAAQGTDPGRARESGLYTSLDAAETLAAFMVDGMPQANRFEAVVGELIATASGRGTRGVRAFGEMVALLWEEGNVAAAIELESLWNDLGQTTAFSLYCAYPLEALADAGDLAATDKICSHHSDVVAPRSYSERASHLAPVDDRTERSQLFVPVPAAAPAVRCFVREALMAWGAADLVDDASVIATELASNAIRHASSAFRATVTRSDSTVRIAVQDVSPAQPEYCEAVAESSGGRGIALVACLSTRWGTEASADGKVVWAELTP